MQYRKSLKNRPTLKNKPPPIFMNEVVQKVAFLLKVCPPIYVVASTCSYAAKQEALKN